MRATSWLLVPALAFVCIYIGTWTLKPAEAQLTPQEIDNLHDFFNKYSENGTKFSYDQLKKWFEDQTDKSLIFEKYPRLFAFCVTSTQIKNTTRTKTTSHIARFEKIMEFQEVSGDRFYAFNKSRHLADPKYNSKSWIQNITLSRINTPEMDMVNLRQWIHVSVSFTIPLKGLYIQAVVGPLGLPYGEFSNEFPCVDDSESDDIDVAGELAPCTYRPKYTITHPSAFVGRDENGRTEFHTNYFWTDITCMETPYIQFLLIAVKDFDAEPKEEVTHQALLSPVYLNLDFDSKSGASYPYYAEWKDKMYCYLNASTLQSTYSTLYVTPPNVYPSIKLGADTQYDGIRWNVSDKIFRIQPNEKYDSCLTSDVLQPFPDRDSQRLECPPGPFRCNSSYGLNANETARQRLMLATNEANVSNCIPCGAPTCEASGFSEDDCRNRAKLPAVTVSNVTNHVETTEQITKGKVHGIASMLAFLVLVPLSNFVARFYKEVCGDCLCGNGPWIFFHVATHVLSIVVMWLSIGPVTPKLLDYKDAVTQCHDAYPDKNEAANCIQQVSFGNPHVPLAVFAFLMQHLLVAFGFIRAANKKLRSIQIILHSHFGHACWLLGGMAGLVSAFNEMHSCLDPRFFTSLLVGVPIIFFAGGIAIDCLNDSKIGIIPPRKQWPVLEAVKLEGKGPCTMPKSIILSAFASIMMVVWVIALGSNMSLISGAPEISNVTDPDIPGKFKLVFPVGVFKCEIDAEL